MFLPSGRVHALGAGLVIFEIQQNSDTTYRVFDWNRVDARGKPRDLHVQQSLESIDFNDFEPSLLPVGFPPRPSGANQPFIMYELFNVNLRRLSNGEVFNLAGGRMEIIGLLSGAAQIVSSDVTVDLAAGQFCLVPASCSGAGVRAIGNTEFLEVTR